MGIPVQYIPRKAFDTKKRTDKTSRQKFHPNK